MQLRTRVSLGSVFAASAVGATVLAWHAQCAMPEPRTLVLEPILPAIAPAPVVTAQPEPQASPPEAAVDETDNEGEAPGPDAPSATLDHLELDWMPAGYVRHVGAAKTQELAQLVEAWAASDGDEPRVEYRKGVVFARSAEDRGDDGPYPRSANPQGERVCGEASVWLRTALRERLANEVLTCDRNVCMYGGMEYAPDGYIVFRPVTIDGETTWALDAWFETYRAALDPATVDRNQAEVVRALKAQAGTSCAGEPAGAY